MADYLGISRINYLELENGNLDTYSREVIDKLLELYEITPENLLDDFNRFLYYGQGNLLKKFREEHGMDIKEFAELVGTWPLMLSRWENDSVKMTKNSWDKYFRGLIKV